MAIKRIQIQSPEIVTALDLYTVEQIRHCEALASTVHHASDMMDTAGLFAFQCLKKYFPQAKKILVCCGAGNNAGDGYVLALLAHAAGFAVTIHQYKDPENLPPIAGQKAMDAMDSMIPIQSFDEPLDLEADLIVDALLGIGLQGTVKPPLSGLIAQINDSHLPVLSIDIPSGLEADTGSVMGICVKATVTATFIGHKQGFFTNDGPDHCGQILLHDLNLGASLARIKPAVTTLTASSLGMRLKNTHKGNFGHVLIVGGNLGMPGSVCLAAMAAAAAGAGTVTVATKPQSVTHLSRFPEAMVYAVEDELDLMDYLLDNATVCLIGPGLGSDPWAIRLFAKIMASTKPTVIDASALRLLADGPQQDDNWILTPHPGEAAALLGCTTKQVEANRFKAVSSIQQQYGGVVVLKGTGSLIQTEALNTYLCLDGNPGMATAGTGDVLSGLIAGLVAQQLPLSKAACLGVYWHAKAGDLAAEKKGERGLIASDLIAFLPTLVNE